MRAFLALGSIAALGLIFVGAVYVKSSPPVRALSEREMFWQQQIHEKGGVAAYEALAASVRDEQNGTQHSEAHAFGAALFAEEGTGGLIVCDARFSYGCFHEFLGRAIATLGIESIPELNDSCFETLSQSPLSCQHGIGHGALAAFGYDDKSLIQSLNECKNLDRADPIGGCYGGVFMEYNIRTMLGAEATAREYAGNPFSPCDTLDDVYVPACMYWQPQWWRQAVLHDKPLPEQFKAMGNYCRDFATTDRMTRTCFEGIGNVVAQAADFKAPNIRTLCDATGVTKLERLFCRAVGANHLGIDVSAEAAAAVCAGLADASRTYCMAYATNKANIAVVIPSPL